LQDATRKLLFFALVFSPWAAASEPAWALWTLNGAGFLLFLIQTARWLDRRGIADSALDDAPLSNRWVGWTLAGVVGFVLLWCLISALNARGQANVTSGTWQAYAHYVPWLPHSFDGPATWKAFFHGVALAGFFWGTRNWFITRVLPDGSDSTENTSTDPRRKRRRSKTLPQPLQELLWLLGISGALLTVAALLQRTTPTLRLLGIFEDPLGRDGLTHFGPFGYRNNAAQYLGMIWPLVLGLWLFGGPKRRRRLVSAPDRIGGSPKILLVLCGLLVLGGTLGTLSRGGWGVALLTVVVVGAVAVAKWFPRNPRWTWLGALAMAATLGGVFWVAWPAVKSRFQGQFDALPLNHPEGLDEFTLAGTLDLKRWQETGRVFLGLFPRRQIFSGAPRTIYAYVRLGENGYLSISFWNEEHQLCRRIRVPDLFQKVKKSKLELAIVYREGLRVFANGHLLTYAEPPKGNQPQWPQRFSGNYVKNFGRYVSGGPRCRGFDRVAVWDRAIPFQQVSDWLLNKNTVPSIPEPIFDFDYQNLAVGTLLWFKEGTLLSRSQVWASALKMTRLAHWPRVLGGGPGAYPGCYAVSPARLPGLKELHVHNDYLEFLLTFGLPGSLALLGGLGLVLGRPFLRGGVRLPRGFIVLLWTSLLGCLLFACVDWPLFAPTVHLLFVVLCAILSVSSIRKKPHRERLLDDEEEGDTFAALREEAG
jgi:hypothetical protein